MYKKWVYHLDTRLFLYFNARDTNFCRFKLVCLSFCIIADIVTTLDCASRGYHDVSHPDRHQVCVYVYVPLPWLAWAAAARHCACIFMKGVWAADASFTCIYVRIYACICMYVCVCGVASATSRRCRCCCPPPQDLTLPGSTPNRRSPFLEHAGTPNVSTRTPGHRTRGRFTLYTISALTSHQYLRVPTETSLALRILETYVCTFQIPTISFTTSENPNH